MLKQKWLARIMVFVLILSLLPNNAAFAAVDTTVSDWELLCEIDELLINNYLYSDGKSFFPGITEQQLNNNPALLDKLLQELELDSYSGYYTAKDYDEHYSSGGSYAGIGISIEWRTAGSLVISSVADNSPAKNAGLKAGDQIVYVNGTDIRGLSIEESGILLTGESSTALTLGVLRPYTNRILTFTMKREYIYIPNVSFMQVNKNTAIITISLFGSMEDYFDFMEIYDGLADTEITNVIIDIRDNPGGDAYTLHNMLNIIVEEEDITLFTMKYPHNEFNNYPSYGWSEYRPDKLIILVNEYTASAAEVFGGALQDLGYAQLVGQTTYGKSRAQFHIELSNGDMLIFTVSAIELPISGDYEQKGITPDYEVELLLEPYKLPYLAPINTIVTTGSGKSVLAIEQRLAELGFFMELPDETYTWYTHQCLTIFAMANNLKSLTGYVSANMLRALDEEVNKLPDYRSEYYDTQLGKALELCYEP